jgi:hypothetical protein
MPPAMPLIIRMKSPHGSFGDCADFFTARATRGSFFAGDHEAEMTVGALAESVFGQFPGLGGCANAFLDGQDDQRDHGEEHIEFKKCLQFDLDHGELSGA